MYDKFRQLLEKHDVTAYKVAKATKVPTSTLTNWKLGRYKPKVDKLQKIADYFGVSVDYFLNDNEKNKWEG